MNSAQICWHVPAPVSTYVLKTTLMGRQILSLAVGAHKRLVDTLSQHSQISFHTKSLFFASECYTSGEHKMKKA